MKRQTPIQTQKETMPLQMRGLLPHAAVRTNPEYDLPSNGSVQTRFNHDFSQVAVRPSAPIGSQDHSNASCPPRVQAKLKIGKPGDKYEQEADRVADQVMRISDANVKTLANQDEGKNMYVKPVPVIQRFELGSNNSTAELPQIVHDVLRSPGRSLNQATLDFMEPRFGYDFSRVRVHKDENAAESARAVDALAFTVGPHVVFGSGQFAPKADAGRRLLAHELMHVIQQREERGETKINSLHTDKPKSLSELKSEHASQTRPVLPSLRGKTDKFPSLLRDGDAVLQRMSRGQGASPWVNYGLVEVPPNERSRVNAVISLIRAVVSDPEAYDDCHRFFTERCPGGSPASMRTTFNNAVVWKMTQPSGDELARGEVNGINIAYSQRGYDQGEQGLAQTLVHEMMHNCGITGGDEHHLADVAGLYCMGGRNLFSIGLGGGPEISFVEMISYRRILTAWASGRIELTTGGDVNLGGLLSEGITAAMGEERVPGEFASAMVGIRARTNLFWGGERFGGLTGSIDTGVGVGRFALHSPAPGERSTTVAGDLVLQVGTGAEFYIPIGAQAVPVSIEAAYRLAQPLNDEARRINAFLLTLGSRF